jgi:hypothetical protein
MFYLSEQHTGPTEQESTMKMSTEHRNILATAIAPLDTEANRARYRARDIPRGSDVKDIDTRYRWDLFYAATPNGSDAREQVRIGADYNTAHLDTALRAIVPAL